MKAGDKVRAIADKLRAEAEIERKAIARILGAAAKINENYENLISEVVEMVEEDLEG